jgi:predicted metalloprotease with PDZ domain
MCASYLHRIVMRAILAAVAVNVSASAESTGSPVMKLIVDETQAVRKLAFVHEEIQVRPGALALAYPKWIPGEHAPTGPIQQFAVLQIHSGSTALPWTRDPEEINTIHLDIPPGTQRIAVDFDTLVENTISDHQILLAWNTTVLYPRGIDKTKLIIEPSLLLPEGWKNVSSLTGKSQAGNRTDFAPVSLERLIDSPVLAGEFLRIVQLNSSWPAELDITGDTQSAVDKADDAHAFDLFAKLINQDQAMFGFRHWRKMHLLISQSQARPYDGLEHEDSPYSAVGDAALSKKDHLEKFGWILLAHEQSHSWCGKYRRPAELYSKPDYQGPEHTSLLWVYEGLNQYIGLLLATRAGFNDASYARDELARTTTLLSNRSARAEIPLVDTATEDWALRNSFLDGWNDFRRGQDYYDEGALIWLRADTIIREQKQGQKSLDDFLRSFLGQRDTDPVVVPYAREDIEAALGAICPYNWHEFFESRIYRVNSKPPTEGIEAAGWRIAYNDTPLPEPFWFELLPFDVLAGDSIGVATEKDGKIFDVVSGSPAYNAGLGPQMTILAVNGHVYSADAMNAAIAHPPNGKLTLMVRNFDSVEIRELKYVGGLRYPHLERIPGTHDFLSEILAPHSYSQQ